MNKKHPRGCPQSLSWHVWSPGETRTANAAEGTLVSSLLFCLFCLFCSDKMQQQAGLLTLIWSGALSLFPLCCCSTWRFRLWRYHSAMTLIQINFHSGSCGCTFFFWTTFQGHPPLCRLPFFIFLFPVVDYTGSVVPIKFPQTGSMASVWRLTTQSLRVALKSLLTSSDPVFFHSISPVGFQSLGN